MGSNLNKKNWLKKILKMKTKLTLREAGTISLGKYWAAILNTSSISFSGSLMSRDKGSMGCVRSKSSKLHFNLRFWEEEQEKETKIKQKLKTSN